MFAFAARCIAALGCVTLALPGQAIPPVFGRYLLDTWRSQDGVRLAFTSNLVITRDGYLWLSSESGVTRFDGNRFKVFDGSNTPALVGRPRLQTVPLLEDHDGRLWLGSDIGLLAHANGVMQPAQLDTAFTVDQVNAALVDRSGAIWAVTRRGRVVTIPRGGSLIEIPGTMVSFSSSSLTVDPSGAVWIAAGGAATYRVERDSLRQIVLPPDVVAADPTRVHATTDGSVWFGTRTMLVQWQAGVVRRFPLPARGRLSAISSIASSDDGTLWIGTHGVGLYRFDGEQFIPFTTRDGLSDDRVIEIVPDNAGNIWIATRDGLNRFRPIPYDVYTQSSGLPTAMPGGMIGESSGTIWLAPPTGGLYRGRIAGNRADFSQIDAPRAADRVTALASARGGGVWAGRLGGSVTRYRGAASPDSVVLAEMPPITEVLEDGDGTLWIGTWLGLYRVRAGQLTRFASEHGLPDPFVHRIHRDSNGTLWVATQTGIARAEENAEHRFIPHPMPTGSATRAIVLFEAPRGTLWLGSAEGLARVSGGAPAFISLAQGLPERWVGSGDEDDHGHVWLGQLGGLTRVDLDDLLAVADGRANTLSTFETVQALDGLPGGDPGAWPHPWSFRENSGKLWYALGHGLAVIDPEQLSVDARPIRMHVDEVVVDGEQVETGSELVIGPGTRRVEFRYTGVDLTHGPSVRFRYRLDGFDTAWTEAGYSRTAAFTSLAPGAYRFQVAGRAANGEWSPDHAAIAFTVMAPFYQSLWFLAGVVAVALAALWSAHRTILNTRGAAIREERSRMAREIHDSLLQGFGGIALELHAASSRLKLTAAEQPLLDRVLSLIDRTLTQARDVVWDIRQPVLPDADMATTCEEVGERILANSGVTFEVVGSGRATSLAPDAHLESVRILEEALTNVRRHADATRVTISLEYRWREMLLSVQDNGCGFDPATMSKSGHWGLLGMRERASRVGGTLVVASRPGSGTTLSLVVPYRGRLRSFLGRKD
jgi:signal transduction histidine kinase/ligand-binding sensor domain-containing protein